MENNAPKKPIDKDVEDNRLIAAVGYIGILCLIPLFFKKNSKYAQFHGKQGLVLLIGWVINFLIGVFPIIGWLLALIGTIALTVLSLIGIVKALNGEYWEMPYLASYAKKIKL